MRIVSGKLKGRRIIAPKKLPVRPTTDMAKEALFNILNHRFSFKHIRVIDLFSGIGSISLEFASRGTENITSVDKNFNCVKFLSQTAEDLGVELQVIKADVFEFVAKNKLTADIVFADPPYDLETETFIKLVEEILKPENEVELCIIEHSKHMDLSEGLLYQETRNYGGSSFSFFGKEEE
ncbi:RsmD family RNA methyltransferase [Psychroflexus planctonicus]|uniref:Methyltransferase n=1 Tax=Psychroflexus planctonicus TaxID=1526575 RepID=A0ABQ1SG84_9FLAO|nr:RsmD family RNA methyltransferase [Psychroflexus planctonicus]GGE31247.1 methyltransferase [Psychroflexus planctonicus]